MNKHPLIRQWMRLGFEACRVTFQWLPLRVAQVVGRLVGALAYCVLGRYRRMTWEGLRLAFGPRLSEKSQRRIARRVFVGLGKMVMEWLVVARFSPAQLRRVVEVHGLHHLDQALARGRGVIALSAHLGNWELLAMALASHGYNGGVLARSLRYPEYEQVLWNWRARKGVATFPRGSLKKAVRLLRENQILGVLADQDTDSLEGVFVEFFERPAHTPVGPAALSLATGAPILPCFLVRMGGRFRLTLEEPITIARSPDRSRGARDLVEITQAWSRVVEASIRRYPDQWVWMHRRWKTRPATVTGHQRIADSVERIGYNTPRPVSQWQPAAVGLLYAVCCMPLLAGCGRAGTPPVKPAAAATASASGVEPTEQQQMDHFTIFGYAPDGAKRWELTGRGAVVEQEMVTIQQPDAIGYDLPAPQSGAARQAGAARRTYLTATLAQVNQNTRRVRMEHDVTIHTSEGLWLSSSILYWLPDRDEMATDQPVRIETERMLLRGIGATGHAQLKAAKLLRDVEMVLNSSAGEPPDGISHVTITCEGPLAFDYERNIAVFEANVHVKDREGDLYSDTLVAYLEGATRTIRYAEAMGHVRIVNGPHTAHSERAVYEPAKHQVTLLGAPSLLLSPDSDNRSGGAALRVPLAPAMPGLGPVPMPSLHIAQGEPPEGRR